jgi:hypothetical protein
MTMTSLLLAVVVVSIVGSLHCVAMCGPFVAFYSGGDASGGRHRVLSHLSYNLGRLVGYATLGALAGAAGSVVDLAARAAGIGQIAAGIAGGLMILWGVVLLLESLGIRLPALRLPQALSSHAVRLVQRLRRRPPLLRAGLLGLCSGLLPCGWLYAFVVTAAGTASPLTGAAVMAAFWLGNMPILLGVGFGVQTIAKGVRRHIRTLQATALIVVGMIGLVSRVNMPAMALQKVSSALELDAAEAQQPPCHRPNQ